MEYDPRLRKGDRVEVYTAANEWRMAAVVSVARDEVTVIVDGQEYQRAFPWFGARRPVGLVGKILPRT